MANFQIHQGDNIDSLKQYADGHFDAIVTDPPYGIEFLGKDWDQNTGAVETWRQCLRVLKPGGHLLAFSAARTYHHLASNIESVGFEIRDQLMWLYASGFPKAQDVGKAIQRRQGVTQTKKRADCQPTYGGRGEHVTQNQSEDIVPTSPQALEWSGWKTALKPAHEPIVMARKPFKGSTIDNVLTHGVGALNIDATRIAYEDNKDYKSIDDWNNKYKAGSSKIEGFDVYGGVKQEVHKQGRFPSNVMGEVEGYQKFFYCPKVSRKERHCGFEQEEVVDNPEMLRQMGGHFKGTTGEQQTYEGTDVWLPHCGHIKIHGLKHEYQRWLKQQNTIHTESAPQGERRCSLDPHERWHQGMEHKKGDKPDPLAHIPTAPGSGCNQMYGEGQGALHRREAVGNNHPTVKPVALMRYLIKLVVPKNSTILDPFSGSGSTGMAAVELGHTFVGCELDPHYVAIANRRIKGWLQSHPETNTPNPQDLFEFRE